MPAGWQSLIQIRKKPREARGLGTNRVQSKMAQLYTHDGKQKTRGSERPSMRAFSLSEKRGASQTCAFVYQSRHHSALPGKSGDAEGRPGKLLWPTSLAFISTVCKQSPICKAKLQLSPRQFLPLKGEMGVRMGSLRWLCQMCVEGAAPWMPSAFILSLGGSWLGSALYRCWTLSKSLGLFTLHVDTIACSLGAHQHL